MNWEITQNKEYILSGGAPIQLREMFEIMAKQLGVKNVFLSCPFPIAYIGAWIIYGISLKKIDFREKVQRLVEPRAYSHDEATRDFGFNPMPFEVGVREEIEQYKLRK
jgi:nucleoside-diphosphate-sugar epimerase